MTICVYVSIFVYINAGSGDVSAQIKLNVTDALVGLPQIDQSTVPLKDTFQSGKYEYVHIILCTYMYI
jgi:hypothetical protein